VLGEPLAERPRAGGGSERSLNDHDRSVVIVGRDGGLATVHWTVWLGGILGMVLAVVLLLGYLS
jgi:tetrahydromethanopterin S-methyltransferase subunit F